jgi:hypothetical protein
MLLEDLILREGEKKLQPYRITADSLKRESEAYQEYLHRIQRAYEKATYWHGTGRYHYQYEGDSRYTTVSTDSVLDVLNSILEEDGLRPHLDPWIDSGGETISLATTRAHSRLFARIHLYEKDELAYELGSMRFWVQFYILVLAPWLLGSFKGIQLLWKGLLMGPSRKNLHAWISAIRKPENTKLIGLREIFTVYAPGSDIEGNCPILLGINGENLKVINIVPVAHKDHKVEVRTLQPIRVSDFTHIEVPLSRVAETKRFLKEKGVELDVLPLEYVDLYMSDIPLAELAYS